MCVCCLGVCVFVCVLMFVVFMYVMCGGGARGGARGGGVVTVSFFIRRWSVSNSSINQNSKSHPVIPATNIFPPKCSQHTKDNNKLSSLIFLSTQENIKQLDSHNKKRQFSLPCPSSVGRAHVLWFPAGSYKWKYGDIQPPPSYPHHSSVIYHF